MDTNFFRWLIIIILLAHGIGHVLGFLASWTSIPAGFSNQPWVLSTGTTIESTAGRAFGLLWLAAMFAFLGAAIALLGHQDWWRVLAIAGALISLVAILPWWNTVPTGVKTGAVLANIAILVVLLPSWGVEFARSIQITS